MSGAAAGVMATFGGIPLEIVGSAQSSNTTVTSHVIHFDPLPQSGDLIIVIATSDNGNFQSNTGSSYTRVYDDDLAGCGEKLFHKISDGTETSFTLSNPDLTDVDASVLAYVCIRGGEILDNDTAFVTTGGGSADPPALTMNNRELSIIIGHLDDVNTLMSPPTGYTTIERLVAIASTQYCSMAIAYKWITSDGSEDPGVFTPTTTTRHVGTTLRIG